MWTTRNVVLSIVVFGSLILVFLSAYARFWVFKNYTFLVEAPCDPETQICYVRSCDEYCPPNGLETYTVYEINAGNFSSCSDNSCLNVCLDSEEISSCVEIPCTPGEDDVSCSE